MTIYDPATTRANPSGAGWVRDPFPNNKVPSYRFDKVGANILGLYPLPNTAGNSCSNASNFFVAKAQAQTTDQFDSRFDVVPNERNRFNGGMNWRRNMTAPPNNYGTLANANWEPYNDPSEGARLNYTRIQAANFLINARLGVARAIRDIPTKKNINLTELGFPQALQNQMTHPLDIPIVQPSGYGNIGNGCCPFAFLAATTYSSNLNASWVHGKHTIKFGGDLRFLQSYELTGFGTSGQYTVGRDFTQGPNPLVANAVAGNAAASLLLGTGSGFVQVIPGVLTSSRYYALFFQDDMRVTDKLVVNLGLRYDYETGRSERYNQLSWFDFSAPSPLAQKVAAFPNLRGGLRFVGGDTKRQFDGDKNNFGPRFGLAYTINRKTVLRSGYGVFYPLFTGGASGASAGFAGFQVSTPWVSSLDGVTPLNPLSNAFPKGLDLPNVSQMGLMTYVGGALGVTGRDGVIDRKITTGYMQQWNLNLQRAMPGSITLELAYAGSKGTKLSYAGLDLNQLAPQYLSLGTALNQLVANPFYGYISGSGPLTQPQVMRSQLLRPYPHFLNLLALNLDAASSVYHSFQLRAQKQFSQGLTFMVSYSNAKLINDSDNIGSGWGQATSAQNLYDRRADRSLSALDISQRLMINYVYMLPFGRGKHFGSSWSPWLDRAIGGWQFNGVTTFSKGYPLALTATNTSGSYNLVERPNVNGNNPKLPGGRTTDEKLARWFDTSVFSQPVPYTFGNGPRLLPNVRSDGSKNFDMSLFKAFPIREQMRIEFRAELFNAFNTPRFSNPNLVVGNNNFGISSGQANAPRQAQLALKLMF
ncbi:MAG: TonB-dependent receptor [Acidobacteria bacterium]|nr:TonB-dependent receptor [Acidobacteriota bacterium]